MTRVFRQIRFFGIITGILFILHSCILKEFNFSENKLDSDWETQLMFPLFYGEMEFKDFIYDWKSPPIINPSDQIVHLEFGSDSIIPFPKQQIFTASTIIDSFNFLVEGEDYINKATFKYIVTNDSPFPMHLRMFFFDKHSSSDQSVEITAGPFPAFTEGYETSLSLDDIQLGDFKAGNRVEFVSWFDDVPGFNPDTLSAHYPIHLSIVLFGTAHAYYH